jgi:hypothetical protein
VLTLNGLDDHAVPRRPGTAHIVNFLARIIAANDFSKMRDASVATRVAVSAGSYTTAWLASDPERQDSTAQESTGEHRRAQERTEENRNGNGAWRESESSLHSNRSM